MKTPIKNSINRFGLVCFTLAATLFLSAGCVISHPDPLAGWKPASKNPDQVIINSYQEYIKTLPPKKRQFIGTVQFFEDDLGLHAIKIEIGINGTWWQHILVYDQNDKLIKIIKYSSGGYRS